jgi:hypothetical protein
MCVDSHVPQAVFAHPTFVPKLKVLFLDERHLDCSNHSSVNYALGVSPTPNSNGAGAGGDDVGDVDGGTGTGDDDSGVSAGGPNVGDDDGGADTGGVGLGGEWCHSYSGCTHSGGDDRRRCAARR